jgi:flavin-dependent dehydrogenase
MPNNTFLNLEKNHKREEFSVAYREIIKLKKKKNPYKKKLVLIYDNIAPEPGYFWIFSKGEYELNVGIGWEQTKGNELKISIKSVFKEILMKFFSPSEYDVLQAGGYTIPTRYPLLNAVGNGFMTAGDAAFHTDPFLAEGHGPALLAGYYAGFYAVQSLNKGDYTEKGLWDYNIEILKSFGHTHLKSHLFVHMLTKVGMQEFFDFMLGKKIISFEEFRKVRKGEKISKKALLIKIFKISSRISYILNIITFQKQLKKLNSFIIDYPNSPELYESWKKNFDTWLTKQLQIKGK